MDETTGELFWKDAAVVTEHRVRLEFGANLAVMVAGVSTVVMAVVEVIRLVG